MCSETFNLGTEKSIDAIGYYHYALGSTLRDLPDISWDYVKKEKSEDMLHVLQFPYNGEPPRVSKIS